jgi:hypothetical protein
MRIAKIFIAVSVNLFESAKKLFCKIEHHRCRFQQINNTGVNKLKNRSWSIARNFSSEVQFFYIELSFSKWRQKNFHSNFISEEGNLNSIGHPLNMSLNQSTTNVFWMKNFQSYKISGRFATLILIKFNIFNNFF